MKNEISKTYANNITENKVTSIQEKKDYLLNMKRVLIIAKINETFQVLNQKCHDGHGMFVNEDKYQRALAMFADSNDSLEKIFKQIEIAKQDTINSYNVWSMKQMRYQAIKSHKAKTLRR